MNKFKDADRNIKTNKNEETYGYIDTNIKNKAVVLGANYYIGLSIMRCLGENGIYVVAVDYSEDNAYAFSSKYCSEKLIAPHYKKQAEELLAFLIGYANKQEFKPVLFPTADPYVEFVDKYLIELKEHYLIPQTEQGLYTNIMDKGILSKFALKHNVRVPESIQPGADNFVEKVNKEIKYPCLVKPVDSPAFVRKFRRKLFVVNNEMELLEAIERSKTERLEVIIQRIIPGFDDHMYTFDAYLDQNSKVTHWTTCQKLRQYPINYGASVYTQHKYVQELFNIGAPFLEVIGWKGFAEIEFKKDADTGNFYLIEVNVRTTTLNVLLKKVGINMPLLAYKELTGQPIGTKSVTEEKNLVFWYAFEDFFAVREYLKKGQLALMKVLLSYFRPKAHAIWDWRDPAPFLAFFIKIIGKRFRRTNDKI